MSAVHDPPSIELLEHRFGLEPGFPLGVEEELLLVDPRGRLVIVEEPENAVHPWILRQFVDACRSAKDKQTILTTHSPALISYVRPDEIVVVWRSKGRTCMASTP